MDIGNGKREEIHLQTSSGQAHIYIGEGEAQRRMPLLVRGQKNFVVTDSNVFELYKEFFARYFREEEIFVLSAGEENKSFENLGRILGRMTEAGLHRTSRLFAVGGGVVGDIGGLAAALYMRGVSCVQVPTTLLAQADSGVGGKTAVDLCGVKNVVGAFYQPFEVVADTSFLNTLSPREIKCGLGEIVKYAALNGEIFELLLEKADRLGELSFLSSLIAPCVKHKARVVEADEKETGERKSLNVGHTTGHAIELASGMSHGESVLWGMLFETELAKEYAVCEAEYAEALEGIVRRALAVPPLSAPDFSRIEREAVKARSDKKNSENGEICMAVGKKKGEWTILSLPFEKYQRELGRIAKKWQITKEGIRHEND